MSDVIIFSLLALVLFAWVAMRAKRKQDAKTAALKHVFRHVGPPEPDDDAGVYRKSVKWTINDRKRSDKDSGGTEPPAG